MRHNKVTFPILPPPRGGRIRGGHAYGVITPTLSPSTKLGTVSLSNRHSGERENKGESDYIKPASQNGSKRLLAKLSIVSMAVLLMSASGVMGMVATSCVSCHGALDQRNSEPVSLWKGGIHKGGRDRMPRLPWRRSRQSGIGHGPFKRLCGSSR